MTNTTPDEIARAVPEGWTNPFFGWELNLDWSALLPSVNDKIASEGYSLFTIFFMLVLFKGILTSLAGPAPNYDMQRVLSTRTPSEAAKMSGFVSIVLNPPRYLLIASLTVLALVHFSDELRAMGAAADYEAILPFTLREFLPVGLLGFTLAGLLAAFMSSFAAPLNAAPAYVVNDIYRKYINPNASEKTYLRLSYAVATLFVVIGTTFGLYLQSIDSVVNWITAGLYGGYTAANVVKWYWWRMNGWGYFWGMLAGILFALVLGIPQLNLNPLQAFPFFFLICLAAVVLGSLTTKPTDMATLKAFYIKTRPWGFWDAGACRIRGRGPHHREEQRLRTRLINVAVGIVWQTALVAAPIFLVIQQWTPLWICLALIAATSIFLKFSWYDRLKDYPDDLAPQEGEACCGASSVRRDKARFRHDRQVAQQSGQRRTPGHPSRGVAARAPTLTPDVDLEARVERVLSALSLEEKVGQIIQADIGSVTPEDVREYRLGSILNGGNSAPGGDMSAPPSAWLDLADAFWDASMAAGAQDPRDLGHGRDPRQQQRRRRHDLSARDQSWRRGRS